MYHTSLQGFTDEDWKVVTLWIGGNDLCAIKSDEKSVRASYVTGAIARASVQWTMKEGTAKVENKQSKTNRNGLTHATHFNPLL